MGHSYVGPSSWYIIALLLTVFGCVARVCLAEYRALTIIPNRPRNQTYDGVLLA